MSVVPGQTYRTIGVKWWGEGAYERGSIDGSETAAKTLSLVHTDDLIINKIWVRHGSTAIATDAVDGCAASGEFPTFELERSRIEPRWLHWMTKTSEFWTKCDALSRGTSGKNRIRPELFLTITIPMPPLHEQRRIVGRVEALAAKIEEARGLRRSVVEGIEALSRSLLNDASEGAPTSTRMSDLVSLRPPDVQVQPTESYHFAGVYSFGRGVFSGQVKAGLEFSYDRLTRLRIGDFVYPKLMAWEGALGVVPPECDGLVVSTEFPVFEIDQERVLPEVLDVYFRTPSVWQRLSGTSTGTNVRRRRLNPREFLAHEIPLPPMAAQLRLRRIRERGTCIRELQLAIDPELSALLPAILDRAFRGEM